MWNLLIQVNISTNTEHCIIIVMMMGESFKSKEK